MLFKIILSLLFFSGLSCGIKGSPLPPIEKTTQEVMAEPATVLVTPEPIKNKNNFIKKNKKIK